MKNNYTLKLVLAMLVVVLVSLVSFVGVYKGKNLLKDYSLGKDFSKRKVATFSVVEDNTPVPAPTENEGNGENGENTANEEQKQEPISEKDKKKNYNEAKNNIAKRLTTMQSEEYDIRLDEDTGKLVIEVPETMNSTYINEVVAKGKVQIKNKNTNEIITEGKVFNDASAKLDTSTYSKEIVVLNMKFSKEAKQKILDAEGSKVGEDGNQEEVNYAVLLDNEEIYTDTSTTFKSSAETGALDLVMGQSAEGEELEKAYQTALAVTSIIKCGEIPVEYKSESMELVSSSIDVKAIAIVAIISATVMFILTLVKFKGKGILPVLSLVGMVATVLLVLRYTNVKITLFTILGLALITIFNYIVVLKTLNNGKSFKDNFIKAMKTIIPAILVAIVFCCSPYLQLASFGMAIFWGLIVMCIYNALIVRVLIGK